MKSILVKTLCISTVIASSRWLRSGPLLHRIK